MGNAALQRTYRSVHVASGAARKSWCIAAECASWEVPRLAREVVVSAIRGSWLPSTEGFTTSGPVAPPRVKQSDKQHSGHTTGSGLGGDGVIAVPARHEVISVGHKRRMRLHRVALASTRTQCKWWHCGSLEQPSEDAEFDVAACRGFKQCKHCFAVNRRLCDQRAGGTPASRAG